MLVNLDAVALLFASLKAYKLGKRRWSYNQCQLVIQQEGGDDELTVMEAMAHGQSTLEPEYQVHTTENLRRCPYRRRRSYAHGETRQSNSCSEQNSIFKQLLPPRQCAVAGLCLEVPGGQVQSERVDEFRNVMSMQESGVVYLVRLSNDQRVRVHVFVVHDDPEVITSAAATTAILSRVPSIPENCQAVIPKLAWQCRIPRSVHKAFDTGHKRSGNGGLHPHADDEFA